MPFPGLCGLLQPLTVLETTSGTSGPVAACYRAILALAGRAETYLVSFGTASKQMFRAMFNGKP